MLARSAWLPVGPSLALRPRGAQLFPLRLRAPALAPQNREPLELFGQRRALALAGGGGSDGEAGSSEKLSMAWLRGPPLEMDDDAEEVLQAVLGRLAANRVKTVAGLRLAATDIGSAPDYKGSPIVDAGFPDSLGGAPALRQKLKAWSRDFSTPLEHAATVAPAASHAASGALSETLVATTFTSASGVTNEGVLAPFHVELQLPGGPALTLLVEELPRGSLQVPQERGSAFPNVRGYAEKKAGAVLKELGVALVEGKPVSALDRKRIIVVGCPIQQPELLRDILRRVLPDHAQSMDLAQLQPLERRMAEHTKDNETRKEARKPVAFWIGDVGVVVTCPSRGNVRVYASSLRKVLPRVEVRAFVVPEIANDSPVFKAVYGLEEDAAFKETLENAVVVVGAGFDGAGGAPMQDAIAQAIKPELPTEASGRWWRAKIYRPSRMGILGAEKVVFLDWYPSFWGEIAYAFGLTLYEAGAVEVLHLGSKVGSMHRQLVRGLCCPTGFVEVNEHNQRTPVENVKRAFGSATVLGLQSIKTHASVPHAFDEVKFNVLQIAAAEGAQTVDDEGAHYARAAAKAGKPFDAVYYMSDHVWVDNDGSDLALALVGAQEAKTKEERDAEDARRQQQLHQVGGLLARHVKDGRKAKVVRTNSCELLRGSIFARQGAVDEVLVQLRKPFEERRIVWMHGLPGVGKSTAVAAVAKEWRGAVWWLDAAGFVASEGEVAKALQLPPSLTPDDVLVAVKAQARKSEEATLIVVENVDSEERMKEAAERWMGMWLRGAPQVRVLVTARYQVSTCPLERVPKGLLDAVYTLGLDHLRVGLKDEDVKEIDSSDARLLLILKRLHSGGGGDADVEAAREELGSLEMEERDAVWELAKAVDGLPLAITLLARVRGQGMSWAQLLKEWKKHIMVADVSSSASDSESERQAKLNVMLSVTLTLEKLGPEARKLIEDAAALGGGETPLELLLEDFTSPEAIGALNALYSHSLARRVESWNGLWVHALVADAVWEWAGGRREPVDKKAWVDEVVVRVGRLLQERFREQAWVGNMREETRKVASVARFAKRLHGWGAECDGAVAVATGIGQYAESARRMGLFNEALETSEAALGVQVKAYGTREQLEVASMLTSVANVLAAKGELDDANSKLQEALSIQKRVLGGCEHSEVARTLHGMGRVFQDQGKLDDALRIYEESLSIKVKVYGTREHSEVARTLNNMGLVLKAQGKLDEAMRMHQESLNVTVKTYGTSEHHELAWTLNNMAGVLKAQGKLDEAMRMLQESLDVKVKTYGTREHHEVARTLNIKAGVLKAQGKLDEALRMYQESLDVKMKAYGTREHHEVARTLNAMAAVLLIQGKLDEALSMCRESLLTKERTLGKDSLGAAETRVNLALVLLEGGPSGAGEALEHAEAALSVFLAGLPAGHPHIQLARDAVQRAQAALGTGGGDGASR